MAKIRYLAVISEEPEALARFYVDEIGMAELDRSAAGDISLTDGYYNLTLFRQRADLMELRKETGLSHFGMDVDSIDTVLAKYRELVPGGVAVREPDGVQYGDVRISIPNATPSACPKAASGWARASVGCRASAISPSIRSSRSARPIS